MEPKIEGSYHYKLIARAISVLDECDGDKIPLDDLAARMNMSSAHFQKLFSRWAGVSPKRYQQYLALDHARSLLRIDPPHWKHQYRPDSQAKAAYTIFSCDGKL